jgi:tRNA (guanosine-2'-O-)-methyltransferase
MNAIGNSEGLIKFLSGCVTDERWERFNSVIGNRTKHLTVVLEDIYQSHNISAVLRSCECFGVQDVHIIEQRNAFEVNSQIDLGSSKWLTIHKHNSTKCLTSLKQKGYRIIATSPNVDDCSLYDLNIDNKTALVFGTELNGLSDEAYSLADGFMKIPMFGFTESFNISVTVALSLHYLTDILRKSEVKWQLSEHEKNDILLEWLKESVKDSEKIIKHYYKDLREG